MTIATLTGHACLAVGPYSIVMDNSVAQRNGNGPKLQSAGEVIGDPFEISILRREDIAFHKGKGDGDDVHQCNNLPSSRTARGHQGPAGFLILTSGLDQVRFQNFEEKKTSLIEKFLIFKNYFVAWVIIICAIKLLTS